MSWTKENIVIVILFILHAVGGLALSFESLKPLFLSLTPMTFHLTSTKLSRFYLLSAIL